MSFPRRNEPRRLRQTGQGCLDGGAYICFELIKRFKRNLAGRGAILRVQLIPSHDLATHAGDLPERLLGIDLPHWLEERNDVGRHGKSSLQVVDFRPAHHRPERRFGQRDSAWRATSIALGGHRIPGCSCLAGETPASLAEGCVLDMHLPALRGRRLYSIAAGHLSGCAIPAHP